MKGLVLKDFICLKKSFKLFVCVTLGVIAVAVMFVLSSRFGNVADLFNDYDSTDTMSRNMLLTMIDLSLHFILLIPIAFIGNIIDSFEGDRKADFGKTLFSMPLNCYEIVGARYITLLIYGVIGMASSLLSAISICACSETIVLKDMMTVILFFGGLFIMDVCIGIPLVYKFGIKIYSITSIVIICVFAVISGLIIKKEMDIYMDLPDEARMIMLFNEIKDFIIEKGVLVMVLVILFFIGSYFCSVLIVKKKRGDSV